MKQWIAVAVLAITGTGGAFAQNEDPWYPSKYGEGDTLGAINLLSPDKVVEAARLVTTGKTYALGVEVNSKTPAYGTRTFQMNTVSVGDGTGTTLGSNKATANDDWMLAWIGIGSQIDGLGHLGIDHRYYNGLHQSEIFSPNGLLKLGVHALPPIVTRGVLLDAAAHAGRPILDPGTAINRAEIEAIARAQKVSIGRGDVVLIHTGWLSKASTDPQMYLAGQPGLGVGGAEYLAALGVVAIGADSVALEVLPSEDRTQAFPVHQILLAKEGVYILETMNTKQLAEDKVYEFLFVLGQPKFTGAVQAVINPVAIR